MGSYGQKTLCGFRSPPSWLRPSWICGIPFSVHHFLLRSALCQVFGERVSQYLDSRMCLYMSWLEIKGRVKREKPLVITFLLSILIFYVFCFIKGIFQCSVQGNLSLSSLYRSWTSRRFCQGAEEDSQEGRGRSRQSVAAPGLEWPYIPFSPDHYSL